MSREVNGVSRAHTNFLMAAFWSSESSHHWGAAFKYAWSFAIQKRWALITQNTVDFETPRREAAYLIDKSLEWYSQKMKLLSADFRCWSFLRTRGISSKFLRIWSARTDGVFLFCSQLVSTVKTGYHRFIGRAQPGSLHHLLMPGKASKKTSRPDQSPCPSRTSCNFLSNYWVHRFSQKKAAWLSD